MNAALLTTQPSCVRKLARCHGNQRGLRLNHTEKILNHKTIHQINVIDWYLFLCVCAHLLFVLFLIQENVEIQVKTNVRRERSWQMTKQCKSLMQPTLGSINVQEGGTSCTKLTEGPGCFGQPDEGNHRWECELFHSPEWSCLAWSLRLRLISGLVCMSWENTLWSPPLLHWGSFYCTSTSGNASCQPHLRGLPDERLVFLYAWHCNNKSRLYWRYLK